MNNLRGQAQASKAGHDQPEKPIQKLARVLREESLSLQPRLLLAHMIAELIPRFTGGRIRSQILRATGFHIGHGSVILGMPLIYGVGNLRGRLSIGEHVMINIGCVFDLSAPITIGDETAIGHEVMILTSSHHIGQPSRRAGPLTAEPVVIEPGAWLGARSIVLPGVTVGAGSVIGAGAIVTKSVPANTLVGGVPAHVIRTLTD